MSYGIALSQGSHCYHAALCVPQNGELAWYEAPCSASNALLETFGNLAVMGVLLHRVARTHGTKVDVPLEDGRQVRNRQRVLHRRAGAWWPLLRRHVNCSQLRYTTGAGLSRNR